MVRLGLAFALVLGTACGTIPAAGVDGGGNDDGGGTPDAAPADAPVGQMSITVFDQNGNRLPGASWEVWSPGDGAPHATGTTDSAGKATFTVTAGDTLHVGFAQTGSGFNQSQLFTVVDVEPGDDLEFNKNGFVNQPTLGTATISLGGQPMGKNAQIDIGCDLRQTGLGASPVALRIRQDCLFATNQYGILVTTFEDTTNPNTPTAFGHATRTFPGANETFDVPYPTAGSGLAVSRLHLSHLPMALTNFSADSKYHFKGIAFHAPQILQGTPTPPSTLNVPWPMGFADQVEFNLSATLTDATFTSSQVVVQRLASPPSDINIDWEASTLATLTNPMFDGTSFSWVIGGSSVQQQALEDADSYAIISSWSVTTGNGTWYMLAPTSSTSPLAVPMSAAMKAFAPTVGLAPQVNVIALDLDVVAGYTPFKRTFGTNIFGEELDIPTFKARLSATGLFN
jgi:hypothetical protein